MNIRSKPDALTQLISLGDVTTFEPAGDAPEREKAVRDTHLQPERMARLADCIAHVATPKGPKPVLKAMVTTACERDCYYCPFRAGRSQMKRVTFSPDELAGVLETVTRAGKADGLFLSSGIIKGSVNTQEKLLDTAEIVRRKRGYRGYVHLKIMPGIEKDQLLRAMRLADRVSVNLEGATQQRLEALAPKKDYHSELLQMLLWAADLRREHPGEKLASTVTQFVVGAVGETDLELLSVSERLYGQAGLKRVYYSSFGPVVQTPFENLPAADPLRELRLYQASFLLRDYGWGVEDLPFAGAGSLPLDVDPKQAWADVNLREAPVEVNTASKADLLRVPGIGPKGAETILQARRQGRITSLEDLRRLGLRGVGRTADYVLVGGKPAGQMRLL